MLDHDEDNEGLLRVSHTHAIYIVSRNECSVTAVGRPCT